MCIYLFRYEDKWDDKWFIVSYKRLIVVRDVKVIDK